MAIATDVYTLIRPLSTRKSVPNDTHLHIAGRIRAGMRQRRFTIRRLSEAVEVPYRTLQDYLGGTHALPAPVLGRIAEALDVSTDWLILAKPGNFDQHTLAVTIAALDGLRKAATTVGQDMSLLSLARVFADAYAEEYLRHQADGSAATGARKRSGRSARRR